MNKRNNIVSITLQIIKRIVLPSFWRMLKKHIGKGNNHVLNSDELPTSTLNEFFINLGYYATKHLNSTANPPDCVKTRTLCSLFLSSVTEQELINAVKSLTNNKNQSNQSSSS